MEAENSEMEVKSHGGWQSNHWKTRELQMNLKKNRGMEIGIQLFQSSAKVATENLKSECSEQRQLCYSSSCHTPAMAVTQAGTAAPALPLLETHCVQPAP